MLIAFIPLRGGSKSIPLKNIKLINGKPLAFWAIDACEKCSDIDKIIIATDSIEIISILNQFKFTKVEVYNRLSENAQDSSSTEAVMLEYLSVANIKKSDIFILVQATNPFISNNHLTEAISLFRKTPNGSVISCVMNKRFFWNKNGTSINYNWHDRPRRQDFSGQLLENGAFYINSVKNIQHDKNRLTEPISIFEMPEYSSYEIDEPEDWIIVENLLSKTTQKPPKNSRIKLVLSDVDGVLTDGSMYYSEKGDELKRFHTYDGVAISLLKEKGIKTGFVTSENTSIVEARAKKLKVDFVFQGKKNIGKLKIVISLCEQECISLDEVAYIGDDINCKELLEAVGYAACPSNAYHKIKSIPNIYITKSSGGNGALREWVDFLIDNDKC